jgi:predicted Zn-dependent protease with MMP-like domain
MSQVMGHEELDFDALVSEALDSLPEEIARQLENVDVVVEDEPPPDVLAGLRPHTSLFGLYHGIPLTKRGAGYGNVLPDKISIYRGPITRYWRRPDAIRAQIRKTVIHEIGHYFGLSEDRLHELGWG